LDLLKEHVSHSGARDTAAVEVARQLAREYPKSGPRDRAAIVAGMENCLAAERKPLANGLPDNALHVPVAEHLGRMGAAATRPLIKWIKHKAHRDNLVLKRTLILSLGRTRDLKAVKTLEDLLQHENPSVVAWAGVALGQYEDAPLKIRKQIFEELLRILMTAKILKDANGYDVLAVKLYDTIANRFMGTLRGLSGESFGKPEAWNEWWKDNRKRDWDKPEN